MADFDGDQLVTYLNAPDAASGTGDSDPLRTPVSELPRWPLAAVFVGFPLWWLIGVVDAIWIPVAGVMMLFLARSKGVRVPRGFGLYLVFLVWSAFSVIMLSGGLALVGFTYRWLIYASCAAILVYVYNARRALTARYVSGCLTALWVTTFVGGYLGLLLPQVVVRTPLAYLLPGALKSNDLVNHMVIRRLAQYNPDSFLRVDPRPSAPFLYTNNWGNVYSLLLPFVIAYLFEIRGTPRFKWVALLLPVSAVPALLTLNRGMYIGIGVAVLYAALRLAMAGRVRAVAFLAVLALSAVVLYTVLPVQQRVDNRLSDAAQSTSNDTRSSLYLQALALVPGSPLFGYGAPVAGENPDAAPVGTQGQVWVLLVSHGPGATVCFVGFFLVALGRSWRRKDPVGLASSTTLLVGTVELAYYGIVPNGLPIMMVAAAMGMRRPEVAPVVASDSIRPPHHEVEGNR